MTNFSAETVKLFESVLDEIAETLETRVFNTGESIFKEGDKGDRAYFVRIGGVEISKTASDGQLIHLGTIHPGDIFGEMALIDGAPRMANAMAIKDTECVILPRVLFFQELTKAEPFTRFLINTLLVHVRNMGIRIVSQAELAQVPFVERFVNAYIAHGRGVSDVTYFFCDADGEKREIAVQGINDDDLCRLWGTISAKLGFVDDLNVLDDLERQALYDMFGQDTVEELQAGVIELIYDSLTQRAHLVDNAQGLYQALFGSYENPHHLENAVLS
ncbi:cyclic nucleotide-binding domain-containing protein [Magnetospira sp. QH-2]|uniref:cyclic nucleotide-binding domain-containing protein n=1 Tax=Magnetospira sp. (strain QH-2) TaxID=1288970 RepID=UPI00069832FD|nr:cyclic nucleotide-binding domain-containing protein [Magnetospira sp. QH-2]